MHAWTISSETSTSYELTERSVPLPGANEVQIRIATSALNHLDLWVLQGKPRPPLYPHIGGADGSGVVTAIGDEVASISVGDEVILVPTLWCGECDECLHHRTIYCERFGILGEHRLGTFADYVVVNETNLVQKPSSVSWRDAGSFGLTYMTAMRMLNRARVHEHSEVLITGISGGVAQAALAIAKSREARVTVSSRNREVEARALEQGADDFLVGLDSLPKRQFDVVVDSSGSSLWPQTINALRRGGRIVLCGATSGSSVQLDLANIFWNQLEIIGSTMGTRDDLRAALGLLENGHRVVGDQIPFSALPEGLERLARGEQFGKIIVDHLHST